MTSFYKNKKILVTGGTGLIGRPLVDMLVKSGADVTIASLDEPSRAPAGVKFVKVDLREFSSCMEVCKGQEIVFLASLPDLQRHCSGRRGRRLQWRG